MKWVKTIVMLGRIDNATLNLPTKLKDSMTNRGKKFFESECFIASLVLDPRFTWTLNHDVFNFALRDKGIVRQNTEKISKKFF